MFGVSLKRNGELLRIHSVLMNNYSIWLLKSFSGCWRRADWTRARNGKNSTCPIVFAPAYVWNVCKCSCLSLHIYTPSPSSENVAPSDLSFHTSEEQLIWTWTGTEAILLLHFISSPEFTHFRQGEQEDFCMFYTCQLISLPRDMSLIAIIAIITITASKHPAL